jgi:hypothetical protein
MIPCDILLYHLLHPSSTSKRCHIHNLLYKAYCPHFEEHQFVRNGNFFLPPPSVMEYFGAEIDFKLTCLDPPFRSLFAVPTNKFCNEPYCLSLVYPSVRLWMLYLAMNTSSTLCSLTINYKFPSNTTVVVVLYSAMFANVSVIFWPYSGLNTQHGKPWWMFVKTRMRLIKLAYF